jgi:hypothetical protein
MGPKITPNRTVGKRTEGQEKRGNRYAIEVRLWKYGHVLKMEVVRAKKMNRVDMVVSLARQQISKEGPPSNPGRRTESE